MPSIRQTIGAALLALGAFGPAGASAAGLAGDYLAARQASFTGDFAAAAEYYGRAVENDPSNASLLERAVLANVSLGRFEEASALADQLSEQGGNSQLAQMAQVARDAQSENYSAVLMAIDEDRGLGPLADGLIAAWAQLGQGDMSAALVAFDEVSAQQGLSAFAGYHKALALASVGDFDSAEAIFGAGGAGGMANTRRGIMARVEILSQLDRFDQALTLIDETFSGDLDPALVAMRETVAAKEKIPFTHVRSARDGMAEVFYTLAGALAGEQNADLTLIYARIATYLRADHVDAMLLAAELLESLGQYDLAIETYSGVPSDNAVYHAAEIGRAEALRRKGDTDAAIAVLDRLRESHDDMAVVHSTLADFYREQERYADATEAYTAALDRTDEVGERQWFLFYARGIAHERQDMWEQAEADFRRALELNPEQPQVLNYLGYSLVEKQQKLDEALDMIERAVAARPDSGYIVDSLGWVLYRLGRYDEAVGHMERAAELMPVDPVVNDHLGDVYWAVGRELEAEFQWKRALSFVDWEDAAEEVDAERIRRKLEVGLDQVLVEEGAPPLRMAGDAGAEDATGGDAN
ncbi:tetratricopeptide repeat protein [Citreimonas sp.]|uniref:tetratricopeptide repeat protein n=1 Tax=Citreimonas sp. TaxID=3036715 RepID=UPI0035C81998